MSKLKTYQTKTEGIEANLRNQKIKYRGCMSNRTIVKLCCYTGWPNRDWLNLTCKLRPSRCVYE